jgi:hypothetical protein
VSPQNSATTTTSRKPAETNRLNAAKLRPPWVATVTSPVVPLPAEGGPLSSNAATRIQGSASSTAKATMVRQRRSWRTNSTRNGSVR